MQPRMKNPAMILTDAMQAIQALQSATGKGGVPSTTLDLVHLRASQINGCSVCVDSGARQAKKAGESDERLFAVAARREAPTSRMPNVPHWRSPRPPPDSAIGQIRYQTKSGTWPPATTTSGPLQP